MTTTTAHTTTDPVPVDVQHDGLVPWERALAIIRNLLAIVTYVAVLYTLWVGYTALGELSKTIDEITSNYGTGLGL